MKEDIMMRNRLHIILSLLLAVLVTYAIEKPAGRLLDALRAKRNHAK